MGTSKRSLSRRAPLSRRDLVKAGVGTAGAAAVGARLKPGAARAAALQGGDPIIFHSSQLSPIEEAEAMRNVILADFEGEVEFLPQEAGPFVDLVRAQAEAGEGEISLIGGLHGDFALFEADGLLTDLSDLIEELGDRGFITQFLELGRFGGEQLNYIPWMQATYIMAARREALEYLPEGLDEAGLSTSLTYEQLTQWGQNMADAEGQKLGFPAGEDGLLHRFLQGYGYPSFTGGVNTTFASEDAVAMWQWFQSAWEYVNPQATTYGFMEEPLRSGEVWVAWDHTARLLGVLSAIPDEVVTFPAPRGPSGLGFMPVVAGLGIPATAPDVEGARSLIEYLTRPEVQATTLREVGFFPASDVELPEDLPAGVQLEADAVGAQATSEDAIPSLLPVGLGEQNEAYNKVFRDTFQAIVLDGNDPQEVLTEQAENLQAALEAAGASCWAPDPVGGEGVCQVG